MLIVGILKISIFLVRLSFTIVQYRVIMSSLPNFVGALIKWFWENEVLLTLIQYGKIKGSWVMVVWKWAEDVPDIMGFIITTAITSM